MQQLIMRWYHFGDTEKYDIKLPDGYSFVTFDGSDEYRDKWLDTVCYGLTEKRMDRAFFEHCLNEYGKYENDKVFFVEKNNEAAATVTVICDYEKKEGYIHMVACKPEHRGLGLGTAMNQIAVNTLIDAGMTEAYLTTDDFRIPAIKSYLRAGFLPDISNDDFKRRWSNIFKHL